MSWQHEINIKTLIKYFTFFMMSLQNPTGFRFPLIEHFSLD